MDWNAVGAVGEVVGALAVLVTLLYLAAQVRQARGAASREANRAIINDFQRVWTEPLQDEATNLVMRRAMHDWHALSKSEQLTAHVFLTNLVTHFNSTMSMESVSEIAGNTYEAWEDAVLGFIVTDGGRAWWSIASYLFVKEVRERLQRRLDQPDALPPPITEMPF